MIDQSMSDDTFRYLLIPADVSLPIQTLTGSKSGGLGNDELQREAKKYFYERSDKKARQGEYSVARIDYRVVGIPWRFVYVVLRGCNDVFLTCVARRNR